MFISCNQTSRTLRLKRTDRDRNLTGRRRGGGCDGARVVFNEISLATKVNQVVVVVVVVGVATTAADAQHELR